MNTQPNEVEAQVEQQNEADEETQLIVEAPIAVRAGRASSDGWCDGCCTPSMA